MAPPRTMEELRLFLAQAPVASLSTYRRQRFTLRLLVRAEHAGLLTVDWSSESPTVVAR